MIILFEIKRDNSCYGGGGYACDSEPAATVRLARSRIKECGERVHRVRRGLSSSSRRFLAAHFHPVRPSTIANHVRSLPTPPRGLTTFFLFGGAGGGGPPVAPVATAAESPENSSHTTRLSARAHDPYSREKNCQIRFRREPCCYRRGYEQILKSELYDDFKNV